MIVTCPNCQKKFRLDERRLAGKAAMGKCSECGHKFRIEPSRASEEVTCPKCGNKQPGGNECTRCGIVFDKVPAEGYPALPEGMAGGGGPDSGWGSTGPGGFRPEARADQEGPGFSIGAALRFGWNITKSNFLFFIGLLILSIIVSLIPEMVQRLIGSDSILLAFLFGLASIFMDAVVTMGLISVFLKFVDHQQGSFDDFFSPISLVIDYLPSWILYCLVVGLGFLLLIVPGVIWMIKFGFFAYLIVDKHIGPIEALKGSSRITQGFKIDLFLLGLALIGINILGLLAFVVGLLVTIPISGLALAYAYRKLEVQGYGPARISH